MRRTKKDKKEQKKQKHTRQKWGQAFLQGRAEREGRGYTWSSIAAGVPTMLLRPITTALLPAISTPLRSRSSMHPLGVQGHEEGLPPRHPQLPNVHRVETIHVLLPGRPHPGPVPH